MSQDTTIPVSASGYDLRPLRGEARERAAEKLSPEERRVLLDHGTERAFCGTLLGNKHAGVYACRLCGLPLFRSDLKFESGTGWPSFNAPFDKAHIRYIEDRSYGMVRTEIRCAGCDSSSSPRRPPGSGPCSPRSRT